MTAPAPRKPLSRSDYEWLRSQGYTDEDIGNDGYDIPEAPGTLSSFLHGGAQGLTLGFSDELRGLGAALVPGGRDYTEARNEERATLKEARRAHPFATGGGEVVGGMALPVGGFMKVAKGAPTAIKSLAGLATGAAAGMAYGAGRSEAADPEGNASVGEVLDDAGKSGLVGGAVGAALPWAGPVIRKGAAITMRGAGVPRPLAEGLADRLRWGGAQEPPQTVQEMIAAVREPSTTSATEDIMAMLGPRRLDPAKPATLRELFDAKRTAASPDDVAGSITPEAAPPSSRRGAGTYARDAETAERMADRYAKQGNETLAEKWRARAAAAREKIPQAAPKPEVPEQDLEALLRASLNKGKGTATAIGGLTLMDRYKRRKHAAR
jgi:hypothetical protein